MRGDLDSFRHGKRVECLFPYYGRLIGFNITSLVDYGHTASSTTEPVGPKFLRITDIQNGCVNWNCVPYCECKFSDEESTRLKTGDIVFARTGATTGKSFLIKDCPERAVFASYLIRVRANPKVFPDFLAHFFGTPDYWSQISLNAKGAAQLGVNATSLKSLSVPLPPIAEQKRIAAILDKAEEIRSQRRQALEQLDAITQSIFLEMFGDPVSNPKKWSQLSLSDIVIKITDGEHLNPQFSLDGMPIVMAGNVLEDFIDLQNSKKVEIQLGHRFRKKCNPEKGDILLVSRGATIGRLCTVNFSEEFCLMGSVILIKLSNSVIESKYLERLLKHPSMYSKLFNTSGSSAQQAIYLKDLKTLKCLLPPLPLQQEFARRVEAIAKLKANHRESLAKLDALFASLQHRAFRGEL
jgi:type I restriction enzyme, S subunit